MTSVMLAVLLLASFPASATVEERVRDHVDRAVAGGLEPEDFHHLLLAFGHTRTLPDWALVEELLGRLAQTRRVDPLMRDEIRLLEARRLLDAGRTADARNVFRSMGGLQRFWVHGPRAIDELEDFSREAVPPAADAGWRPAAGVDGLGWVRLAGVAWPAGRQMVHLATTVSSPVEQPVAVRLGAAQVARAWLNGREVLTTPQPLDRAEDQAVGGGWLAAGNNLLVVAVAAESDDWWLRVRLTAPDGGAVAGLAELDLPPAPIVPVDRRAPEVRSLEGEITRAVEAGRSGAMTALAAFLVARHPEPVDRGRAREACRAARAESPAEARLLEWRLAAEPGAARELLEEALAADPELAWARLELARWYHDRDLAETALTLLEDIVDEPAGRAVALDLEADRWGPVVLPELERLSERHPRSVMVGEILARRALDWNRWPVAGVALERLRGLRPAGADVLDLEERRAAECGDGPGLRSLFEGMLERDPNLVGARIRLARLLLADDDHGAAVAILEEGLARCPDHVELLVELARIERAAGNDGPAAELARRVLELRPQERRAQRLLERLGELVDDQSWRRSPEELRELAAGASRSAPGSVVLTRTEIRFLPGQLVEERVQEAILVNDAERAEGLLGHPIPWVPESQRLRVVAARILRADGGEVSATQSDTPRLAEPEINLYYDTRLRVLRFAELEDGDLIELAWIVSETVEANETGPYKGGIVRLGRSMPIHRAEVVLAGPDGSLPAFELVHLEGEPSRTVDDHGATLLTWAWNDLPAVPQDVPRAPELLVTPHLLYSNHPTWGDLADWYGRHVAPRVRTTRLVEETAQRLTEGVADRLERIARIYRYVTNDIRYVGLEFGEHRFRPFSADWVIEHRIGDCKDKAGLLVALLDAADIPARVVMIRTADLGPVPSRLALLELFNHAIAYLPEDDLWLDGTAAGHALYPPPGMDQGAYVLVVEGLGSEPSLTPQPGVGRTRQRFELAPGPEAGRLELTISSEDTGEAADLRRLRLAGSRDPRRVARWVQGLFPGAEVVGEPTLQVVPSRDPTLLEIEARLPRTALTSAGGIRVYPGDLEWLEKLEPRGDRTTPLVVTPSAKLEWILEVELGRPPRPLPTLESVRGDRGALELEITGLATGYRVEGRLEVESGLVDADAAPGLRDFLVAVGRQLRRPLEVP